MSRPFRLALVVIATMTALAAWADVPSQISPDLLPEHIDSPEFIVWLPVERTAEQAEVLLVFDWRARDHFAMVRLLPEAVEVYRITGDGIRRLAQRNIAGLPAPGTSGEIVLRRRGADLVVSLDGVPLLHSLYVSDAGTRAGAWATKGATVGDLLVQPLGDIDFDEDFFQVEDVPARWETLKGNWQVGVYWDPLQERDNRPLGSSWYEPGDGTCLTATGYDFWDCYRYEATVRLPQGTGGLAFHVLGPDDWCVFEVGGEAVRIVQMHDGRRSVLAKGAVVLRPDWWYRLRADVSTGHVRCFVNDQPVLEADLSPALIGRIGLYTQDATGARFDDISVRPLTVARIPLGANAEEVFAFDEGTWRLEDDALQGRVRGSAVATLRGTNGYESVSARISATRDAVAGVVLDHRRTTVKSALIFTIQASSRPIWRLHRVWGDETVKLAEGPAPAVRARLDLRCIRGHVTCLLDGQVLFETYLLHDLSGAAGVYLQDGRAVFSDFECRRMNDAPRAVICRADGDNTPLPALEEKKHIRPLGDLWRLQMGTWRVQQTPDGPRIIARPAAEGRAVVRFHEVTPGEPRLIVDADCTGDDDARLILGISMSDEPGYRAEFIPAENRFRLWRRDEIVHDSGMGGADALMLAPAELRRKRDLVIVHGFGQSGGFAWRDPEPLADGRAEVIVSGGEMRLRSIVLASDSAFAYPFDRIEPDWQPRSGTWTSHTGMACILWDYWLTGDGREEPALIWNRHLMPSDVTLDVSAAEYTEGFPDGEHRHYPYHDIRLMLCGDPATNEVGYTFIVGADHGRRTVLLRNGAEVAARDDPRFRIVMGGHCNTPRAVRLRAQKSGAVLTLTFNGMEALRWEDPEPLGDGYVGLGCEDCRVIFRDCVIYPAAGATPS